MGIGGDYPYKLLVDEEKIIFSFKHTRNSFECLLNMVVLEVFNIHITYTGYTLDLHRKAFGVQKVFRVLRALPVQYTSRVQSARYIRRQKHASDTTGACLWKVWSIALGGWEHCYWKLGALLLEYKSMPFRGAKACLLGVQKHACLDTKASRA